MHYQIRQPQTEEEFKSYYKFRWQLLRAPWQQPEGSEIDDIEDQCYQVMVLNRKSNIIGVARLQFNSAIEAQIRYMAVAEKYQKQGIGRTIIDTLEHYAIDSNRKKIILDAREPAVGFYQKLGYNVIEKSYLLFGRIQHFKMLKEL